MGYSFKERFKIHQRAKRLVGMKKDAQDKRIFMETCIDEMMQSGESEDEGDARDVCEMLWAEEQDLYD